MNAPYEFKLNIFSDIRGTLSTLDTETLPFHPRRMFIVNGKAQQIRGQHAHKLCTQLCFCLSGEISVQCYWKNNTETRLMNEPNVGLVIPPLVWSQQKYLSENAVLLVLCDRLYEPEDYVHSFVEFKRLMQLTFQ